MTDDTTTPWEQIEDDGYLSWLLERQIIADEFNAINLIDWSKLRTQYDKREQQQQQLQLLQQQQASAFVVGVLVLGAKQSNGARGNVFKFLERHMGRYSEQEGIQIFYEQENLRVKAYFVSEDSACLFQNALNEWEIHKDLANLGGVTLDPLTPARINRPVDLVQIFLQDYTPQDSESPCRSIDQLHSYGLSIPLTEEVNAASPIARYQCLDEQLIGFNPYKCHLKDKAKLKSLQNNEEKVDRSRNVIEYCLDCWLGRLNKTFWDQIVHNSQDTRTEEDMCVSDWQELFLSILRASKIQRARPGTSKKTKIKNKL